MKNILDTKSVYSAEENDSAVLTESFFFSSCDVTKDYFLLYFLSRYVAL
jgi:hypothetical protein